GTTGVGKSSAVVLMLSEILRVRPDLRIFVLDAHNEYAKPFADKALVLNPRPAAAVLVVQFRGDGGRHFRRPSRLGRRDCHSCGGDSARQSELQLIPRAA